ISKLTPSGGPVVSGPDNTSTSVTSSVNPSALNQAISFTAHILDTSNGRSTSAGTVQFKIDGSNFGTVLTLSGGLATSGSTSALTAGTHAVTASYGPSDDTLWSLSSGTLPGGQVVGHLASTTTVSAS